MPLVQYITPRHTEQTCRGGPSMWQALIRQAAFYFLTRRGKAVFALAGTFLLFFFTAMLLDARMYLTAGFMGAVTLAFVSWRAITFLPRRAPHVSERDRKPRKPPNEPPLRKCAVRSSNKPGLCSRMPRELQQLTRPSSRRQAYQARVTNSGHGGLTKAVKTVAGNSRSGWAVAACLGCS
jgi:hypothetical protein